MQAQNGTGRGANPVAVMAFGSDVAWHESAGNFVPPVGNVHFSNVSVRDGGKKSSRPFLSLYSPAQPLRNGGMSKPNGSLVYSVSGSFTVEEEAGKAGRTPDLGPEPEKRNVSVSVVCK